ncbi:hypothetical protein Hanom_Chr16g01508621 [Helianthus anomalus]
MHELMRMNNRLSSSWLRILLQTIEHSISKISHQILRSFIHNVTIEPTPPPQH